MTQRGNTISASYRFLVLLLQIFSLSVSLVWMSGPVFLSCPSWFLSVGLSDLRREECSSVQVCRDFSRSQMGGMWSLRLGGLWLTDKYRWKWIRSTWCHWGHTHTDSSPAMPTWEGGERSATVAMGLAKRESCISLTQVSRVPITWMFACNTAFVLLYLLFPLCITSMWTEPCGEGLKLPAR